MSTPLSKKDLSTVADGLRETIRESAREVVTQFQKSQAAQDGRIDERFDRVDGRLDQLDSRVDMIAEDVTKIKAAVVDLLSTDRHLHNLVRELKAKGVPLDEAKVFSA